MPHLCLAVPSVSFVSFFSGPTGHTTVSITVAHVVRNQELCQI